MRYTATGELEEHLAQHGLARQHEIDDSEHTEMVAKLRLSPSHALESEEELHHRAAYALLWKNHLLERKASLEERLAALEKDIKRNYWIAIGLGVLVLFLLALATRAHAQDSVVIRGAGKGTTTAAPVTATPNGANHTGLDVNVLNAGSGGTASGFGSPFPATGTAGGFKDNNGNMAGANLDSTGNLFVNCASGCTSTGDTIGAAQTLAALNNAAAVALAGERSVSFTLPAGNTLVATLVPEASFDGGTTWASSFLRQDGQNAWQGSLAAGSTVGAFHILVPGGASNIRIRVSSYTSGSAANVSLRAVAQPEALPGWAGILGLPSSPQWVQVAGSDGTNDRALKTDSSGDLSVTFPAAQPISASTLPLPAGASTDATATNPQFSAGATTAPSKVLLVGGKTTDATPQYQPLPLTSGGAAVKIDGTATTQSVSVASLPLPANAAQETGGNLATLAGGVAGSVYQTNIKQIGGTAIVADPCQANTKLFVSVNQTANTRLVTGTASKKIFPCSIHLVTGTAQNIALVEGTGTTCGTGTAGVQGFGGATAATGWNLAANGGLTYGNGASAIGAEGSAADDLCLFQSGTGQVSGGLSYVVQ